MRLWTLHPRYLDARGLVALWREGLLAKHVLAGKTRGYRHHPQLQRFLEHARPAAAIDVYLGAVLAEARRRGYAFDGKKIDGLRLRSPLPETRGQLLYEWDHLLRKLRTRDPARYRELRKLDSPEPHPLFRLVAGGIRSWERVTAGSAKPRRKSASARR